MTWNPGLAKKTDIGIKPFVPGSGEWNRPYMTGVGTATFAIDAMYLQRIDISVVQQYIRVGTNITATGSSPSTLSIRLGVYGDDGTAFRPTGAPLFDWGTVDALSGTGNKLITIDYTPALGSYWLAWVMQGEVTTSPTVVTMAEVQQINITDLGNSSLRSYVQTGVTGALPTIGTLAPATNSPIVGLRAA